MVLNTDGWCPIAKKMCTDDCMLIVDNENGSKFCAIGVIATSLDYTLDETIKISSTLKDKSRRG